jgi:hypothetical protein
MRTRIQTALSFVTVPVIAAGCAGAARSDESSSTSSAAIGHATVELSFGLGLTGVPNANAKSPGFAPPNVLSPELIETVVAQGSNPVENPVVINASTTPPIAITNYGYESNGPFVPAFGSVVEGTKTEPDKNTYLVLNDQTGPDAGYDYGRHFLFQGHEVSAQNEAGQTVGYITRVNLDADFAHRVTLWATADSSGAPLTIFDGSTWDPFAQRLLFTSEGSKTYQSTVTFPPTVDDISGSIGRGGYEGVQNDSAGNVLLVEDVGGVKGATLAKNAKQPNSFVYRFVPSRANDLTQGKLQVLQVISLRTGTPIAFHAGQADADILSPDVGDLHTYGTVFDTKWVTIHDTAVDGTAAFDANPLAKAGLGTPFKRPENGQFRPGSGFREFFFDETGDTDNRSEAGAAFGGFGSILKFVQASPTANTGKLSLFYLSDAAHSGFDNVAFWSQDQIVFVEDAGDTLHTQRNALDSAFAFDVRLDYSNPANLPVRIIAEGRDPSATTDSGLLGQPGFQNEGDNEITGLHVSNGDPSRFGILGAQIPRPFSFGWRAFYTQQHGDNDTWELLPKGGRDDD